MSELSIPHELAEDIHRSLVESQSTLARELAELLYPDPVTYEDYVNAGRQSELAPGTWCEDDQGELLILGFGSSTQEVLAVNNLGQELTYTSDEITPRFDLMPAWKENGLPWSLGEIKTRFPELEAKVEPIALYFETDFKNVPVGTIAVEAEMFVYIKTNDNQWLLGTLSLTNKEIADRTSKVIIVRWG